jgi:cobalt-zinc-cadmium efflux system outer membrane protein
MKYIILWTAAIGLSFSTPALTLDEALQHAAENSPELRRDRAEAQAASADIRVVSAWSNPELAFEVEGLGGDTGGTDFAEYTLNLSQEVPTSGKNRKARRVATYTADAVRLAGREAGLDFQMTVRLAFIDAQAAQEICTVRERQQTLAEDFLNASQKRHEVGAASELDVLRAEMMLATGQGDRQTAEKNLNAALQKLARLTGVPMIGTVEGRFFHSLEISGGLTLNQMHPALQRFQTLENQADAAVLLERSAGIPDVTLGAGARYEENGNVQSYLFSASIPLPLFNRGRAGALAAGLRAEAVRFEHERVSRELEEALAQTRAEFEIASAEVSRFQTVLLPKAQRAVELVQEGYAAGRYGWLEQVEVQQMLAEIRMGAIEAQRAALRAQAQLLKFTEGEFK